MLVPFSQERQLAGIGRDPALLQPELCGMNRHPGEGNDACGRKLFRRQQNIPVEGISSIEDRIIFFPEDMHLIAVRIPVHIYIRSGHGRELLSVDHGRVEGELVSCGKHRVGEKDESVGLQGGCEVLQLACAR